MEILIAIQVLINCIVMTMNLLKHLFTAISFKLMAIKIELNEVERNTAINFLYIFCDHFMTIKASWQTTNIQIFVLNCFCRQYVSTGMH